ncbi:RHS repeat-associated core domain-containing protein [Amycolatopsis vastitatis]|uniref:Type IV secretion protein Rhs n=1 Tax=Amycolatopsis vastitatis TaxID=1905142 RepID=A0A229SUF8_9PSEU|nr:RHS repeat-associated core domain-containing protein [Amycolatopsis vastitatis]OXM62695.1 type IV secretion protein Rhs [Amycolatopsis vastitatis]
MSNPLVAAKQDSTTWHTGINVLDDAIGAYDGIKSGSWIEGGIAALGTAMDLLTIAMNPVGTLISYGLNWLIEHVQPLQDALNQLAGDADQITAYSQTWGNIAKAVEKAAKDLGDSVRKDTANWTGRAADAYRANVKNKIDHLNAAATCAIGISTVVEIVGVITAAVRAMVRDMITQAVGDFIQDALEEVCSLGLGTPVVVAQVVEQVAAWIEKIGALVKKLINSVEKLRPLMSKLEEIFAAVKKVMSELHGRPGEGGTHVSSAEPGHSGPHEPGAPHDGTSPSSAPEPDGGVPDGTPPGSHGAEPNAPGGHDPEAAGGQKSEGTGGCDGKGGDPVDAVSGQMITAGTDVELPGLLPLVLNRAYASGYADGRSFGPGWASTLDQRLVLTDDFVRYYGADAEVLSYIHPARDGSPVLPSFGARWPLSWDAAAENYLLADRESGWTRRFAAHPTVPGEWQISSLSDRSGHRVDYLRDELGRPLAVTHSGGYRVGVDTVDGADGLRIAAYRLLGGGEHGEDVPIVSFRYDRRGRLSGIVNSTGAPYQYDYDGADRIVAWTDRTGYRYEYEYGPDGRVVRGAGLDGYLDATFDYDLTGRVTVVTDSLGGRTEYHYDEHNHITAVVDPNGGVERPEFDRFHRLLSFTDKNGAVTRYERDENGDPTRIEYPDGTALTIEYDPRWRLPVTVTQPNGAVWRHTYDDAGRVVSTVDPLGAVATSELDERGHLAATVEPDGARWTYTSDDAGRPLSVTSPDGETTTFRLDGFGRAVEATDPRGRTTRYGWTREGALVWRVAANGDREERFYDLEGSLVRARSATGAMTAFERGPFGLLTARTGQDGVRHTFTHDTELRLTGVRNPAGQTWSYRYDPAGNLIGEQDFTGRALEYRVDAMGALISRAEAGGAVTELTRDVRGRVSRRTSGETTIAYDYDEGGRLRRVADDAVEVTYERDLLGRPVAESVDGRVLRSEYDVAGRRVRRITPSGVEARWHYDQLRRETALTGTAGTVTFEYREGREVLRRLGENASLAQTHDELGRLAGQTLFSDGEPDRALQERSFRYRADGQVLAIDDRVHGTRVFALTPGGRVTGVQAAGWTEQYTYDALGNLVSAQPGPSTEDDSDVAGPRAVEGMLLRSAGRTSYSYDASGRIVREVRRSLSGRRRIREYAWNDRDQLIGVTTPDGTRWRYRYDPFGRRIAKQRLAPDGGIAEETTFSWDGTVLAEAARTVDGRTTVTSWDYRGGSAEPIAQTTRSWLADAPTAVIDTRFHAIVADLIGAPTELVDAAGRVTWYRTSGLWGNTIAMSTSDGIGCPLRFPGQYHDDETGLHYNVHRYYDPHTARYLSPDPIGLTPSANHYTYVPNPLAVADPLGLAGYRDPSSQQWARDPALPPADHIHNRGTEYPGGYWQSTHDEMATKWTLEGRALGRVPRDPSGARVPHDQLNWVDAQGRPIPYYDANGNRNLTYEHVPPVVEHWRDEGHNMTDEERKAWYNNTDDMEAMGRSQNSSEGAQLTDRYAETEPGPRHPCTLH